MTRKTSGIIMFAVFAMMAMVAQSVVAAPVVSYTACLKETPGVPLGTAVYKERESGRLTLEITVSVVDNLDYDGTYCISINKVKLVDAELSPITLTVIDGEGSLSLDTNSGDPVPLIEQGWPISLKNCVTGVVLHGMFQ